MTEMENAPAEQSADKKTHAQIMLQKIESILEGKPDNDIASYQIEGRAINRIPYKELREIRKDYLAERRRELDEERAACGLPTRNKVRALFR